MHNLWAIDEYTAKQLSELMRATDLATLASSSISMPDPEGEVRDRTAIIPIFGVLTKNADNGIIRFLAGGGTSYQTIIKQIRAAEENPEVDSIEYLIDSPGGAVNGLFDAARAIRESSKPSTAVISGRAASGAYGLASQADKIVASNESDIVGSIGVVQSFFVSENIIDITSSNAPFKAPDPKSQEGFKAIQDQLNMMENHFINLIASGRNVTAEIIKSNYGRGGILTADIALSRGMIDEIENQTVSMSGDAFVSARGSMQAGPTAYQDLDIVDKRWDSTAAVNRVRRATNSTEKPGRDYRKAFFWFDSDKSDTFGAYKLPFVDVVDGKLVAVRRAIFAADQAMAGARDGVDLPEKDKARVQRHIDRYKAKIEKMDKEKQGSSKTLRTGGTHMKLRELLNENPEAAEEHAKLISEAEARGVNTERTRVKAHLVHIGHSKDTVVKAITEGQEFDAAASSEYMLAATKVSQGGARAADNPDGVITDDGLDGNGGAQAQADAAAIDKALEGIGAGGDASIFG